LHFLLPFPLLSKFPKFIRALFFFVWHFSPHYSPLLLELLHSPRVANLISMFCLSANADIGMSHPHEDDELLEAAAANSLGGSQTIGTGGGGGAAAAAAAANWTELDCGWLEEVRHIQVN
jgi:hypothetical protein